VKIISSSQVFSIRVYFLFIYEAKAMMLAEAERRGNHVVVNSNSVTENGPLKKDGTCL